MVYTHSTNIYGLVKLFLLKFSVGLIVLEVRVAEQCWMCMCRVCSVVGYNPRGLCSAYVLVPYRMRDQLLQTLAAPPCCFVCCEGHVIDLRRDFVALWV
jgi:hypothetical protein